MEGFKNFSSFLVAYPAFLLRFSPRGQPRHSDFLETERNLRLPGYLNGHASELGNEWSVDGQTETKRVSYLLGAGYKATENHSLLPH